MLTRFVLILGFTVISDSLIDDLSDITASQTCNYIYAWPPPRNLFSFPLSYLFLLTWFEGPNCLQPAKIGA